MSNGFLQRFQGKISAAALWVAGYPQAGPGSAVAYSTAAGEQTLGPEKVSLITASSALSVFDLGSPPYPGVEKDIHIVSVSSGVFIKAAAGTAFDPSTNTVFKSTYAMLVSLIGETSLKWGIKSVFPPSTAGVATNGGITLSTTT